MGSNCSNCSKQSTEIFKSIASNPQFIDLVNQLYVDHVLDTPKIYDKSITPLNTKLNKDLEKYIIKSPFMKNIINPPDSTQIVSVDQSNPV